MLILPMELLSKVSDGNSLQILFLCLRVSFLLCDGKKLFYNKDFTVLRTVAMEQFSRYLFALCSSSRNLDSAYRM